MNLPTNYLRVFPVGYQLRGGRAIAPERTRHLRPRRGARPVDSPVDIMFFDSFPGARNHLGHAAIDILGGLGLPVYATKSGRVADRWRVVRDGTSTQRPGSGTDVRGGNFITLVDDQGLYHYYCHLESPPKYAPGTMVRAGGLIGYLGGSGSRGRGRHQHLHYQVSARNDVGALDESVNPYRELVRLAQTAGGSFEMLSIEGYPANKRWMHVRPENYRRR